MTTLQRTNEAPHVLLLGASGVSGLALIKEHLALADSAANKPYLTLYVRASGRSKLTSVLPSATKSDNPAPRIRIVEGGLTDAAAVRTALSADATFPKVTAVLSVLGAYTSLYHFLTRTQPTPIGDALNSTIIPAMQELNVNRILVLSTTGAFPVPGEDKTKSWGWYLNSFIPWIVVPQGNAEMRAIGEAVLNNKGNSLQPVKGLSATVFRVPLLTNESSDLEVVAFILGGENNTENKTLSRGSMSRWLFKELEEGKWVGGAPSLCNRG